MSVRTLTVDGLANARDLGGLERTDGSLTPAGVFYRAEKLDRLTPDGWRMLHARGIRTVVDLRRPEERSGAVPPDIHRVHVDLDGDEQDFWEPIEADGRWGTPLYYASHLHTLPHRLSGVLEAIATAGPGAVMFHCAAGWDRTGLVAAVLLRATGVTTDAATADYLLSYANAPALEKLHGRPSHVSERLAVLDRYGHSPESAFRAMFDEIDLDVWFDHAGVPATTRKAIRSWRGGTGATSAVISS